jgi:hypothetical protein
MDEKQMFVEYLFPRRAVYQIPSVNGDRGQV